MSVEPSLAAATSAPAFVLITYRLAHTCGVTPADVAYCSGDNTVGELGDGTFDSSITPVRVHGTRTFNQMSAGLNHTCGVSSGKASCWGGNAEGQIGDGSLTRTNVPKAVAGGLTFKG